MSLLALAAQIGTRRQAIIVSFFKERNALTPETATTLDDAWFKKQGIDTLWGANYVIKTPEGKYWLNESKIPTRKQLLMYFVLAFIVTFLILYFLI